jgi:hypothetical protein
VAGSCVYDDGPSGSIKCGNSLSSLGQFSFSGRTLLHGVSFITRCTRVNNFKMSEIV